MTAKTFYIKGKKYNCVKNGTPYFRKSAVINGKQRSFYGDGEKDALRKIEEAKAMERKGFDFDKRSDRTGDVFRDWLFNIKRLDRGIKASTFSTYEGQYRKFIADSKLGDTPLSALSPVGLQLFLNNMVETGRATGNGVAFFLRLFKQFCRWAEDNGYLVKNPCRNIIIPGERVKKKKEVETFTAEERAKLLQYMTDTDYKYDAIIRLAFATGMRKGELLALRWEDIEDEVIHVRRATRSYTEVNEDGTRNSKQAIWDTKTAAGQRDIPILKSTSDMLKTLKHDQKVYCFSKGIPQSKYVFINQRGNLIPASNFDKSYTALLKNAGIPHKKFHAIRHTFATEAIRKGVPVRELQVLMGHANISTTYIYVHASEDSKRQAIELLGEMM